jgi:hypothetical protein
MGLASVPMCVVGAPSTRWCLQRAERSQVAGIEQSTRSDDSGELDGPRPGCSGDWSRPCVGFPARRIAEVGRVISELLRVFSETLRELGLAGTSAPRRGGRRASRAHLRRTQGARPSGAGVLKQEQVN